MFQYQCLNPISKVGLDGFTNDYTKTEEIVSRFFQKSFTLLSHLFRILLTVESTKSFLI